MPGASWETDAEEGRMSRASTGASVDPSLSPSDRAAPTPGRGLWWIGAGILAIGALSVVVVLMLGNTEPTRFEAGTPERALQDYLAAYESGDYTAAYAFFSTRARSQATRQEYRDVAIGWGYGFDAPDRRVLFDGRSGTGDQAVLALSVEEYSGGLGGNVYRSPRQVPMVRENGSWRIDALLIWLDPGPWPNEKSI